MSERPRPGTGALLASVHGLVASADVTELAGAVALLSRDVLQSTAVLVLLRGEQGICRGGNGSTSDLEAWADELCQEGALAGVAVSRGRLAAPVQGRGVGFQGVVVVSEPGLREDEARAALGELGRLASTCLAQVVSRARDASARSAARASLAKGLHDLRTPLNSMRLGMHLLGPGLVGQDPSVVERTHRAIDRMAALVTEMFESLSNDSSGD